MKGVFFGKGEAYWFFGFASLLALAPLFCRSLAGVLRLPSLQGFLFSFHLFVHFVYNFIYFALACFFFRKTTSAVLRRGCLSAPLSPNAFVYFLFFVFDCKITILLKNKHYQLLRKYIQLLRKYIKIVYHRPPICFHLPLFH